MDLNLENAPRKSALLTVDNYKSFTSQILYYYFGASRNY